MSLLIVRHGDAGLTGPLAGWVDRPLTKEGMKQAANTAQSLVGLHPFKVVTDDLMRSIQTAQAIALALRTDVHFLPALRPWNSGDLANKEMPEEEAHKYYDNPLLKAPGGEPLKTMFDRVSVPLVTMIESHHLYIMVGHRSTIATAVGLAATKGRGVNLEAFKYAPKVEHAGLLRIGMDWVIEHHEPKEPERVFPSRATKSAVLYMHKQFDGPKYQCRNCVTFIPGKLRCMQHGQSDVIQPYGQCGLFAKGTPQPGLSPTGAVTKEESGYWDNPKGSSCGQCEYFLAEREDCQKVDPNSPGDDPGKIKAGACCNHFEFP